eukprot:TRINITY_DN2717_c1_g2_i1.p1 TRINITY_DN2717_c1_g2~~TRINITY_DN2717_c1_g2_i1.p1  ORF type:complete len:245 (+),score=27.86 TRINITY_DN2717_c1_g2_i1:217-951(+)
MITADSATLTPRRRDSTAVQRKATRRTSRLSQNACVILNGSLQYTESPRTVDSSAMFKQANFSQNLNEYKFGNWGKRRFFLPTIPRSEESPVIIQNLRELTQKGDLEGMSILLHSGVSANLVVDPVRHRTPLHIAASREDVLMSQLLLRFHADPSIRDGSLDGPTPEKMGWSAVDIAKARECLCLVAFFNLEVSRVESRPPEGVAGRLTVGLELPGSRDRNAILERPIRLDLRASEPGFMRSDS